MHQPRHPTECNPDHRSADDPCEVRTLLDTISICNFIEEDAGHDLNSASAWGDEMKFYVSLTWCMPKNSAMARIIPVYHGRNVKVINMT